MRRRCDVANGHLIDTGWSYCSQLSISSRSRTLPLESRQCRRFTAECVNFFAFFLRHMMLLSTIRTLLWLCFLAGAATGLNLRHVFSRRARRANQLQGLILSRRTINEFEAELPSNWETSLQSAIEAATFAPNHKRTEPWRFHLLGEQSIRQVCELNAKLVAETKGEAAGDKKLKRWLAMPGWLVVTCRYDDTSSASSSSAPSMENPMSLAREDYAACCCAVQNLCLSLHAQGLGTKWTTGAVNFDEGFAQAAGLPSDEYVVGTIWFGTPKSQPNPPNKKLALEDVLVRHE